MTIINGDTGLMGTTNEEFKYILLSDALVEEDIKLSMFNTLSFTKE